MRHLWMLVVLAGSLGLARAEEAANAGDVRLQKIEQRVKAAEATLEQIAALELPLTLRKQKEMEVDQDKEIANSKDNIGKLDRRQVYAEHRIEKLKELEADINGLKDAVGNLKMEFLTIRERLTAIEKLLTEGKK